MARIATGNLIQLLRRVSIAMDAGVDARTIWDKESRQGPSEMRQYLSRIRDAVARGDTVSSAMQTCDDFFPPLVVDMIDVGEQTGSVEAVLRKLLEHYEHLRDLRRMFLKGIAWPAIQLVAALFIVGLLIWILGMIGSFSGTEPVDILGLGLVGNRGLLIYVTLLVMAGAAVAGSVYAFRNGRLGTAPIQMAMATPGLGKVIQVFSLARFCWTLSLSLGSGADARTSLRLALRSTQNPYYASHTQEVDQAILNRGVEMHEALRGTDVFPADFLHSLETAELAGASSEALEKLAQEYQRRAETTSKVMTVAAAMIVYGGVALFIIMLIFRLAYFYISTIYKFAEGL
jgi:type IV pilus assembly protein PilC